MNNSLVILKGNYRVQLVNRAYYIRKALILKVKHAIGALGLAKLRKIYGFLCEWPASNSALEAGINFLNVLLMELRRKFVSIAAR